MCAQQTYQVSHYTSTNGLPQNSVRGLTFDENGFLWIATEGGIARFDGRSFKVYGPEDHPDIYSQRFTHALRCNDSTVLFVDERDGMFRLSGNRFSTMVEPGHNDLDIIEIHGGLPRPDLLIRDTFLRKAIRKHRPALTVFPAGKERLYVITDRLTEVDLRRREQRTLRKGPFPAKRFALLNDRLLYLDEEGLLRWFQPENNNFKPCMLVDERGQLERKKFSNPKFHSRYPFSELFVEDQGQLFQLTATVDPSRFVVRRLIDRLPGKAKVLDLAYLPSEEVLAIGADTRGLFLYREQAFTTFMHQLPMKGHHNNNYAQCMMDSVSMLTSRGLILDIRDFSIKDRFQHPFHPNWLYADSSSNLYYIGRNDKRIYKYDLQKSFTTPLKLQKEDVFYSIMPGKGSVWLGANTGLYRIRGDSALPVLSRSFLRMDKIRCLEQDATDRLWFGTKNQLYRLNLLTRQLDSFPELERADIRALRYTGGKLFIGTYGKGYYVCRGERFTRLPTGSNSGLSNVHTFIQDQDGYLWMTTNRGLYKTHLDAVDAYLQDTTLGLFHYVYLEEDGIHNAEFNGGCFPAHVWLPDGRLALPTLEGLVFFDPSQTGHLFNRDSLLFSRIEIDEKAVPVAPKFHVPAGHYSVTVHFTTAWWGHSSNQYAEYRLEGLQADFQRVLPEQRVCSFGRLKPGAYTLELRKRIGFGPDDYVYSRLPFFVEKPWYSRGWAFGLYGVGFLMTVWGVSAGYTQSIRRRNIALKQKVDEQTAELLQANTRLELNLGKLAESERSLRRNIRIKDRLISIITHDALTPLRFIGMIARLGVEDTPEDQSSAKEALTDVQNAVGKLFHSTQNILNWVKYQQEQFKPTLTNCSPFVLVDQLFLDFREMADFQGNALINEVPEDDIIRTDANILYIILHNLLSNAVKFTQNGEIHIRSGVEQNWCLLEVQDNGRGMTPTQLESARQKLTGKASFGAIPEITRPDEVVPEDASAGTGIGLTLVGELINILNGSCRIDSPENKGVVVCIYLPLTNSD